MKQIGKVRRGSRVFNSAKSLLVSGRQSPAAALFVVGSSNIGNTSIVPVTQSVLRSRSCYFDASKPSTGGGESAIFLLAPSPCIIGSALVTDRRKVFVRLSGIEVGILDDAAKPVLYVRHPYPCETISVDASSSRYFPRIFSSFVDANPGFWIPILDPESWRDFDVFLLQQ
eukprot:scaffold374_cov160-Amphora_coffeaeformis.AAC.8